MEIRITRGVGSSPKLWAILSNGRHRDQVGEFDTSDKPGQYDAEADSISGMSGIIWGMDGFVLPRKLYASIEEWADDLRAVWPCASVVRADSEKPRWP